MTIHSHVFSMVPLAWACRAAGHEVRFAAQPRVVDTIVRAGLAAVPVGGATDFQDDLAEHLRSLPPSWPETPNIVDPLITTARNCAADAIAFGRSWRPDLVVTDPLAYGGPLVAEALGVPFVRLLFGPDWPRFGFGFGGYVAGQRQTNWPASLTELYESYGVPTGVDLAIGTLDLAPPSLQVPGLVNRVSMRPVPYCGSAPEPAWLATPPTKPRVCLTWGTNTTLVMGDRSFLVPEILAGVQDLDIELVLAMSGPNLMFSGLDRRRLGSPPPNARLVEHLPLDLVLPSCAALVSQGGAGALLAAAGYGVPQVTVPVMADQPTNARLLAATGAGISVRADPLDPAEVRAAVAAVAFDAGPRAAAERLREEIQAMPLPAQVVSQLEEMAATGRHASVS
ncbi:nucleotide disphospho-sugar-binding domain-containing protein [Micromonospora sp. WMMD1082]|uniref:nucleotide disphospho-sugar-binding domain-containing protein n=1 Tax=Micromonospora sp. WMMD1082 TaxID=3016104 RepID=UPI002417F59E|nr:nucleotide disphospho-sugar-binding domain-containing protein [Micromonospora sp. WMMD1082]MDG4792765.1 DUF1205 domain-containing protein [Micromonospora sp. WMMD1082]